MARILIVDDEPDMRLAVRNVLKLRGHEIYEAGDGPSALKITREAHPDLVLLDLRLPGMDGIEVLAGIKALNEAIPVVMITGYGHIQSAVDVMKLGASEYLQKPFENAQLVETVRKFTAGLPSPVLPAARAAEPVVPVPLPGPSAAAAARRAVPVSLWLAAAALLAAAGAYRYFSGVRQNYYREYQVNPANISALLWVGDELYAGDWLTQSVYVYKLSGDELKLARTLPLEKTHISGLAAAGDTLYVADSWKHTVEARRLTGALPLTGTSPLPGKTSAIFYDGEYLWTSDSEGNAVLLRPGSGLAQAASYKLAEKPDQIYKDGKYLWTAVSASGSVYRRRLDQDLTVEAVFTLKNPVPGHPLAAFSWHGGRFWFARNGLPAIIESGKAELVAR